MKTYRIRLIKHDDYNWQVGLFAYDASYVLAWLAPTPEGRRFVAPIYGAHRYSKFKNKDNAVRCGIEAATIQEFNIQDFEIEH